MKTRHILAIAILFLLATPALADDSADCKQTADPSLAIHACEKVFEASGENRRERVVLPLTNFSAADRWCGPEDRAGEVSLRGAKHLGHLIGATH